MSWKHGSVPENLATLQQQFAAHIRNPELSPAPTDIEDRRMDIYRNLFFNNIRSLLAWNFPVIRRLYSQEKWNLLVRDFYTHHKAGTPLFPELPREFLQYLQEQRQGKAGDPPFLLELAHYEWVELSLAMDEREIDDIAADPDGDLMSGIPVLSRLAMPLSYRFPVHQISPDFRPAHAPGEATHLLAYRNRKDEVKFMKLNAVSALMLQLLKEENDRTGQQLLNEIAILMAHPKPEVVIQGGQQLLTDLFEREVILGTRTGTKPNNG